MATKRTEQSLIEDMAARHADVARRRLLDAANKLGSCCNSPIERVMAAALWESFNGPEKWFTCHWSIVPVASLDESHFPFSDVFGFFQVPVSRYVVDIVIVVKLGSVFQRIAIECDGHDFHERTKEQARHDRKRDRALQAAGFRVMRFTGSEIWASPQKCAQEVMDVIYSLFEVA